MKVHYKTNEKTKTNQDKRYSHSMILLLFVVSGKRDQTRDVVDFDF